MNIKFTFDNVTILLIILVFIAVIFMFSSKKELKQFISAEKERLRLFTDYQSNKLGKQKNEKIENNIDEQY